MRRRTRQTTLLHSIEEHPAVLPKLRLADSNEMPQLRGLAGYDREALR
jgi:hypothetical protein